MAHSPIILTPGDAVQAPEQHISAAVETAWKIAANLARSAGSSVEAAHFLYGIFSLDNLSETSVPTFTRVQVLQELEELTRITSATSIGFQQVRRRMRADPSFAMPRLGGLSVSSSADVAVNRSEEVRSAFRTAAQGSTQVRLLPLAHNLLLRVPKAREFLDLDAAAFEHFLDALRTGSKLQETPEPPMEDVALEGMSIFDSLNAEEIAGDRVDWAAIGPHFSLLCELGWQTGTSAKVEILYETALKMVLEAIPAAQRVAIMTADSAGHLLLKAHLPKGVFSASTSSAQKAMVQRKSFIWQRGEDLSASQLASSIQAGIYAPILTTAETLGVICVDAHTSAQRFSHSDLFLLTSLGHQLGLIVANRRLEEDLRRNAKLLQRLLTNFSPKVRDRLMLKAEAGRLRLGGEKSVISVLCCDIRGFTLMTAGMDTEDVVSLLNDYFSAMVAVIFRHGGSVDKFIGDAILAVFGSPEADAMHAEKSLCAALEMQSEVRALSIRRREAGLEPCEIGIGVHTGEVIHGFIGSPERMEFTVIGNAVNLASRYCDAAKSGEVILSSEMLEQVWKQAVVEAVEVQTKHEGTLSAYRLVQMRGTKR